MLVDSSQEGIENGSSWEGMEALSANNWMLPPADVYPALPLALAHVLATCPHLALSAVCCWSFALPPPPQHCLSGAWAPGLGGWEGGSRRALCTDPAPGFPNS